MLTRLRRAAFKPLYQLHYRFLYGRRFPGSRALAEAVARWEERWDRRDVPVSADRWDQEYASGSWDFLEDPVEIERYEAIVAGVGNPTGAGPIVDVGCGEGLLLGFLAEPLHPRYVGVDLSAVAIDRAAKRWPQSRFEAANAETWEPPKNCTAIVLNECLYYFSDPEETTERYRRALAPGGRLLISVVDSLRTQAILDRLDREIGFTSRREIRSGSHRWHLATIER